MFRIEDHRAEFFGGDMDGEPVTWSPTGNMGGEIAPRIGVMHYTAAPFGSTVATFTDPGSRASAHFVIDETGNVVQMIPTNRRAWHAGRSIYKGVRGVNDFSVGVELVNPGWLRRDVLGNFETWWGDPVDPANVIEAAHRLGSEHRFWHKFTPIQLDSAFALGRALVRDLELEDFVGHEDVSPGRKVDPGAAFPMAGFRGHVLGRELDEPMTRDERDEAAALVPENQIPAYVDPESFSVT